MVKKKIILVALFILFYTTYKKSFFCLAEEEKQQKAEAHSKLIDEIRERNRQREDEATFTEIWYTFVDPYATDVDERGTGK